MSGLLNIQRDKVATVNIKENNQIVIIENTEVGGTLPLSIFFTNFIKQLNNVPVTSFSVIASQVLSTSNQASAIKVFETKTNLYSIFGNIQFVFRALNLLKAIGRTSSIKIVHCFYPNSSLMAAVLYKIFWNRRIQIIYELRSPWIEMMSARKFFIKPISIVFKITSQATEFILLRFVKGYVFITEGLYQYYCKTYKIKPDRRNVQIIPSGFDHDIFSANAEPIPRNELNISVNDLLLIHVGGMARLRQLPELLLYFASLLATMPNAYLLFLGSGEVASELQKRSTELGINGHIRFVSNVPHTLVPRYIATANIGISHIPNIPAYRTSFPLKILEYLGCGIPVAATDIPAHREIAKRLNNIYLYDFSQTTFVTTLRTIANRGQSYFDMKKLQDNYSWQSFARHYQALYTHLLE